MSTPEAHRRARRVPAARPRAAAPREPVDWAKVGRNAVRRRARGMTHAQAVAALEDARFWQRQDSRHEDLVQVERGPAELAEWERIEQLLVGTADVYDADTDTVVQAERAADAERQAARERELQEQQTAARAGAAVVNEAEAGEVLRRALARTGVLDPFSGEDQAVAARIADVDPAAAQLVARWLDDAFAAGRAEGGTA